LKKKIVDVMLTMLNKQLLTTIKMVQNLICVQDAYINTYHPDFMGGANSITNVFDINSYQKLQKEKELSEKGSQKGSEVRG